jgi:hypothetical protein
MRVKILIGTILLGTLGAFLLNEFLGEYLGDEVLA